MAARAWESVESFDSSRHAEDVLSVVSSAAGERARYLRSPDGARALVAPLEAVPTDFAGAAPPPGSTPVVFVHPPTVAGALSVAEALGEPDAVRLLALPDGEPSAGLERAPGRVVVPVSGSSVVYALFRQPTPAELDIARLRSAPAVPESEDVAESRARWFQARDSS